MNTKQGMLFIGIACLIICAFVGVTSATTIYVPTDYPTIQQAVDNATAGDTIFVYNGTYYENVVVNNSVILEGEDSTNTFVTGGFYVTVNGTTIKNFNISQGYDWDPDGSGIGGAYKAGIYIVSSHNTFYNNSIQNITGGTGEKSGYPSGGSGGTGTGIYLQSSINNNITSNTIYSIEGGTGGEGVGERTRGGSGGIGVGIYLQSSTDNTITSNIVYSIRGGNGGERGEWWGYTSGGDAGIGAGIYLQSSTDNNLTSNTLYSIQGGTGGTGGTDGSGGNGDIGTGIYLRSSVSNNLTLNTISTIRGGTGGRGGRFGSGGAGWTGAGIYLQASTNNNLSSNTISSIQGGFGGYGTLGESGVNGIRYGIYIDSNSLNNQISITNTVDSDDIIYYYNHSDKTIENYVLTSNSNPTNFGKIVLINCSGFSVYNNTIANFTGKNGGTGRGYRDRGGTGGIGTGIYLQFSNDNNITSNTIYSVKGGIGGTGGYWGSGGAGGIGVGIYLQSSANNKITSNTIYAIQGGRGGKGGHKDGGGDGDNGIGIYLQSSTNNSIISNTVYSIQGGIGGKKGAYSRGLNGANGDGYGISLWDSSNNTLKNNIMYNTEHNFSLLGEDLSDYINDIDTTNKINGKSICYLVNEKDKIIDSSWNISYLGIVNSKNITVRDLILTKNSQGVLFANTSNSKIENVTTLNNKHGIFLLNSSNNFLKENNVSNNRYKGIYLDSSSYNTITTNTALNNRIGICLGVSSNNTLTNNIINSNNRDGIYLTYSSNNALIKNNANSNRYSGISLDYSSNNALIKNNANSNRYSGISLDYSSNNTLTNNIINSNNWRGIDLWISSKNKVYLNNFFDNRYYNVYSYASTNIWNSTSKITYTYNGTIYTNYTGNYWSDYIGNDSNNDGLGDTPYSTDSDKDNYPLIKPFESYIPPEIQKGMSYAAWWHDTYATKNSDTSLENLKTTGTEWVSLIVTWYQDNVSSTEIDNDSNRTPTDDSLIHAINKIHSLNMSVMLKPTVDLQVQNGNWRGSIHFDSEDEWDAWFSSYERFILHYADIAEKNNVVQFCVGVEYKGTVHRESEWRNVIDKVRERYTGPITYASNWDNYQNIDWWDALNFVGIDAYFPLTDKKDPSIEELKDEWKRWEKEIESWQQRVNKPIIFTEIGYCSRDSTNIKPYDYWTPGSVDLQEQADCYNATFQTFWDKPWLAGIYWWMWDSNPEVGGPLDKSYTTYRKPAESIVKEYYCPEKVSFDTCSPAIPYPSIFANIL